MTVRQDFAISFCLNATLSMLSETDMASVETVRRDHRGAPSDAVTVNGQKAKVTRASKSEGRNGKAGMTSLARRAKEAPHPV